MSTNGRQIVGGGDRKVVLGYLGSATLLVALFSPSVVLPAGGSVNYLWNGAAATAALLAAAVASSFALLSRRYWMLWLSGGAALVLVAITLARAVLRVDSASAVAGGMRLQWGWPLLVLGALLLLASAWIARREGASTPRLFWDAALAALLLVVAVAIGPAFLSGTHQAVSDYEIAKKQEERVRWEPHEYAREVMNATRQQVRVEESRDHLESEAAPLSVADGQRRRAEERSAAQVRLVADLRRWYPSFAESVRPVLEARHGFLADYEVGGLDSARSSCAAVADLVGAAEERLPASPDRAVDGQARRLLALYLASARACRGEGPTAAVLGDLERVEESIGIQLDQLAQSLSAYCLRLPAGGAALDRPATVLECVPRDRVATVP